MGILNRTPDSFSDGGRFVDDGAAVAQRRRHDRRGRLDRRHRGGVHAARARPRSTPPSRSLASGAWCACAAERGVLVSIDTTSPDGGGARAARRRARREQRLPGARGRARRARGASTARRSCSCTAAAPWPRCGLLHVRRRRLRRRGRRRRARVVRGGRALPSAPACRARIWSSILASASSRTRVTRWSSALASTSSSRSASPCSWARAASRSWPAPSTPPGGRVHSRRRSAASEAASRLRSPASSGALPSCASTTWPRPGRRSPWQRPSARVSRRPRAASRAVEGRAGHA